MKWFRGSERRRMVIAHGFGSAAIVMAMLYAGAAQAQSSYGTDQRYCDRSAISQVLSPTTGNILGSAAGGAVGGLLGSQIGKGSGNTAATIIGVLGGALGGGYIGRSMQPADQGCVTQSLDHAPTNQPVAWQNPSNGSSYWVTPTRDLRGPRGEPCREYVTDAVIDGRPQRTRNTACQQPDGNWVPLARNEVHVARPAAREGAYSAPAPISRDMVFRVQQRLRDLGFYVRDNIDGQWGPRTSVAVRNFQRAKGLDPSGQLNSATLTALNLR